MSPPSLAMRAERWMALRAHRRLLPLVGHTGIVSFSFDDAPQSACQTGAAVLEKHHCHGTWYVAGALTDKMDLGHMSHSVRDICNLRDSGHQIGCHTYSHTPCAGMSLIQLNAEFQRNDEFLEQCGVTDRPLHFSFPLGAFDLRSKLHAGRRFGSCRITGGGIQSGYADLNALKTERLYDSVMSAATLQSLVCTNAEKKGWLIFYSHDVEREPSKWGCTPHLLESAVQMSLAAGCKVLPIEQAIDYWRSV